MVFEKDYENLVTVDIICHGMPPAAYLQQHVEFVESLKMSELHCCVLETRSIIQIHIHLR